MAALRIEHIVHELDIVPLPLKAYPLGRQQIGLPLQVHAVFGNGGVFQQSFSFLQGHGGHLAIGRYHYPTPAEHQAGLARLLRGL